MITAPHKKLIAVVEDQFLFRQVLVDSLKEFNDLEIAFDAGNGSEMLYELEKRIPHIILLDYKMPLMDGASALVKLKSRYPQVKVIMLSMHDDQEFISDVLSKGADAFINKNVDIEKIISTINKVLPDWPIKAPKRSKLLSDREIEIMKLLCEEFTTFEIADMLNIGKRTVDTYRKNILKKTGSKNLAGIVFFALQHRFIKKVKPQSDNFYLRETA